MAKSIEKALSPREKELIDLNYNLIKEETSFSIKVFFTIVSIIIGAVGLYLKSGTSTFGSGFIVLISIGLSLFIIQTIMTVSDLRSDFNSLCSKIIDSDNLDKYKIKKSSLLKRIMDGLLVGFIFGISILVISNKLLISIIFVIIVGLGVIFSPRYY